MAISPFTPHHLRWTDSMSTGIRKIDTQHRVLIRLLNGLDITLCENQVNNVPELLEAFDDYARVHFADEEILLEEYGYPETEAHKHEHEVYRNRIREFKIQSADSVPQTGHDLLSFLREWLSHHILIVDKKYSSFLMSKGLS